MLQKSVDRVKVYWSNKHTFLRYLNSTIMISFILQKIANTAKYFKTIPSLELIAFSESKVFMYP